MRTVQISEQLVDSLLKQPKFYVAVPEFGGLKPFVTGKKEQKPGCCGPAIQKNVNWLPDFVRIVRSLNADGLNRLKQFVGADNLQYHTNQELKQI